MKISPKLFIALAFTLSAWTITSAQPLNGKPPRAEAGPDAQVNLLQELSLSPDQVKQLREMNRERKPKMEAAQTRMREANRSLDQAVYSDALDENEVATRLKEFQDAQADVARIRFNSEVSLRKILTPEQLVRFRDVRARVAENRKTIQELRKENQKTRRPLQRIRQMQRQNPAKAN
jgi:Spy/CpxP family protein refolding chaperone